MGDRDTPRYMPPQLRDELRRWAPPEITDNELWTLSRIAERIYAAGYDDGHRAGYEDGRDDARRPNSNQVNQIREALKERAAAGGDHG